MSKLLLLLLVILPLGVSIWLLCTVPFTNEGMALFAGAFFSIILAKLWDIFGTHYARVQRNNNALVKIELHLNRLLNVCEHHRYSLQEALETLLASPPGVVRLMRHNNEPLEPIPEDRLTELTNIDLINDLFRINSFVTSLTADAESCRQLREDQIMPLLGTDLEEEGARLLQRQVERYSNLLGILIRAHARFFALLLEHSAKVRLLLRRRDWISRLLVWSLKGRYPRKFAKHVEREIKALQKEVAEEQARPGLVDPPPNTPPASTRPTE